MSAEIPVIQRQRSRQRLRPLDSDQSERHASWLELFFDLVFVLAVSKVAAILVKDPSLDGFIKYLVLFIPVWWSWVGFTFYADRFESDEPEYRILTFTGMLAVAALAVTVGGAFSLSGDAAFAVCYSLVLFVIVAHYARTAIYVPLARGLAMQFITGLGISGLLFLTSVLFEPPIRYIVWALAIIVSFSTPFLNIRLTRIIPFDHSHIPERFGLFTIIVLGEAVIATANGAAGVPWTFTTVGTAALGFAMAACIWWMIFEFVEDGAIRSSALFKRFAYIYGHFFIVVSIVTIGVGVEHAIKEAGEPHLHRATLVMLGGGIATYLAVITIIRLITGVCGLINIRIGAIIVSLAIAAAGFMLPPMAVIGGLLAVLTLGVWLEGRYTDDAEEEEELPSLFPCEHEAEAVQFHPRSSNGCEECIKNNYKWVHLRLCLACGHVGCCDSSRYKHATKHFHKEKHHLMASLEDGEHWSWCYADERFVPLAKRVGKLKLDKLESEESPS